MEDREAAAEIDRVLTRLQGLERESSDLLVHAISRLGPSLRKRYQAALLRSTFGGAAALAQACGWNGAVVLKGGKVMVDQDGVLLTADDDTRYFRGNGAPTGRRMLKQLRRMGVPVSTVFDVGANIGEIALYFARQLPEARVFAFEPAPENLLAFEANLALQPAPLPNLTLIREAVSDRRGEIEITTGGMALNSVLVEANLERIGRQGPIAVRRVPTDTLDGFCRRLEVDEIDFLKVDIEGAEPLLAAAIAALEGRIRAACVEVSRYNTLPAYLDLVAAFDAAGLSLLDKDRKPVANPQAFLRSGLQAAAAMNVWFLRRGDPGQR